MSALDEHSSRFGDYPYGEADIVLDNNFWFGGMGYPGFVLDRVSSSTLEFKAAAQAAAPTDLTAFWKERHI